MKSGEEGAKCKVESKKVRGMLQVGNERDRSSRRIGFSYDGRREK
jgi:hypothetical protein